MQTPKVGWPLALLERYPDPNTWDKAKGIHKNDVFRFAQQWLTEGVPFAFEGEPLTFERAREVMAKVIGESPKHISLTGSSRLGHSLGDNFGAKYHDKSDIDLFVVSQSLFEKLAVDGQEFARRVVSGEAKPSSKGEAAWWPTTAANMEDHVSRKFYIDHKTLPRAERYPTVSLLYSAIEKFESSLSRNASRPRRWDTSVRIYRDWDTAIAKIGGSVLKALRAQGFKIDGEERAPRVGNGATMSQLAEQLKGLAAKK